MIDGQNRRVGKKINGVFQQGWLYSDQLRIAAELDGSGQVVSRFIYGTRSNVPDLMIKSGITYRILSDQRGSPVAVVDTSSGQTIQYRSYDEFGNLTADTNPGLHPFGFAGGLYDVDTGLTRFGARDYDPYTGRWAAKDPIGFLGGSANLYAYAANDAINFIDPTGLKIYPPDFIGPMQPGDVISRSGEAFGSPDAAARTALAEICATSVAEDREYGGRVYTWGQFGPYYYNMPERGEQHGMPQLPVEPSGSTLVAGYHSHGAESGPRYSDESPSPVDRAAADALGVMSYLVTPSGRMKRYNPDTNKQLAGSMKDLGRCSCR